MNTQSNRINNKSKFKIKKVERKRHVSKIDTKTEVSQPNVKDLNISNTGSNDNNTSQNSNNTEVLIATAKPITNPAKQPSNSANVKNSDPISSSLGVASSAKFKKSGKYFKMSRISRDKVDKTSDLSSTLLNELNLNEVKFQDLNTYLNRK
ncbi:hypothetical protein CONCODRAFT_82591 [Conidiobolus coronatus NRRL 28638]|uniref:Uncharacterized protein n=1 Tax=Conidiobolus coronatus (strain ATCC 28846 / CBS 209.66 / NRRL 28638) TaxID=796925 RepID=A0A137PJ78_CONC2|nr:hypothetical protein CONCODRAFT_82591 [Conidiobolus coronatus NRRL 28638]|eukprot:KXN75058.1 hypothetical protein CONCODRAFT_82591 [Conidiobolus coronatus NRRL 28638]